VRGLRAQRLLERIGECALVPRDAGNVHERGAEVGGIGGEVEHTGTLALGP
jgi:hypothetical protein